MMRLHDNREVFLEVITATSDYFKIPAEQIEKDYYVSYLLEHLVKVSPEIVFKGGTSLSKCYDVVKRFSEDIDINFATDKIPTQGEKRKFKNDIFIAIDRAKLELLNPADIRSRRDHNNYEVGFPQLTTSTGKVREYLLLETFVPIKTFPTEKRNVSSYILEFLESEEEIDVIKKYNLQSFKVSVQQINRTFVDKLFAICDYFEQGNINRQSRHLYDLHKIFESNYIDISKFQSLFERVKLERQNKPDINISSQLGYNISETIEHILRNDVFLQDYAEITMSLLFEEVPYKDVKASLYELLRQELIPNNDFD